MQVRVLRTLHHRNIVQFYGACLEPTSMFFVTELMKVRSARTLQTLWEHNCLFCVLLDISD